MCRASIGFTHLSKHANARLLQRTVFREDEFIKLLNNYSFVSLGVETGCYREHCLIYCLFNNEYYVAVQDRKFGTVITILTLEYHQTLSWRMSSNSHMVNEKLLREAKEAACHKLVNSFTSKSISLKIRYLNADGKLRVATIKKFAAESCYLNPQMILEDRSKITDLATKWLQKSDFTTIVDLFLSQGRNSKPTFCDEDLVEQLNGKHTTPNG